MKKGGPPVANWDPNDHPRGPGGKFSTAGSLRVPLKSGKMFHPESDTFYQKSAPTSKLNDDDRTVVKQYAWDGVSFERINRKLRGDDSGELSGADAEGVRQLTQAVNRHTLTKPTVVYRGVPDDPKNRKLLRWVVVRSRDGQGRGGGERVIDLDDDRWRKRLMAALNLTETTRAKGKSAAGDPKGDNLHDYWTRDPEGLAKWASSPHPWTALYTHLKKYIENDMVAKATASKWYHDVFGHWPGDKKDGDKKDRSGLLQWLVDNERRAWDEALHPRAPGGKFGAGKQTEPAGKAKPQPKGTKPWSKMSAHEKHVAHLKHLAHLKAQKKKGEKGKTPGAKIVSAGASTGAGDKPRKPPGPERARQLKAELGKVADQMKAARKKGDKKKLMELAAQAAKLKNQLEGRDSRPDIDIYQGRNMDMMGAGGGHGPHEIDSSWDESDGDEEFPDLQDVTLEDLIEAARILGMLLDQADGEDAPSGAETAGRALSSDDMPGLGEGGRFKKLKAKLAAKGAKDPEALAAWIGRHKYGKKAFAEMAAAAKTNKRSEPPASLAEWRAAWERRKIEIRS